MHGYDIMGPPSSGPHCYPYVLIIEVSLMAPLQ